MPHDGPGEHYHDLGERVAGEDDAIVLTTVGLDIGSSTSQAVFSRITLTRADAYYVVAERSVLHQSEVILTPYSTPDLMDRSRLAAFIESEFAAAKLTRAQVQTGAVIMTGLALEAANARAIADIMADDSGRFVAVSAGDLLEARLAANGAGLPGLSARHPGLILHVDIGGGTTKLSTWRAGEIQRLAAIDVGARLLTIDARRRIATIAPPLLRAARELNIDLAVGQVLEDSVAEILGAALAEEILRCGGLIHGPMRDPALLRTEPLLRDADAADIGAVIFSGGVSEYIYGRESRAFGDLGIALGRAVRRRIDASEIDMIDTGRGIRATVLGASQHSVQLSGNTIFVSDAAPLPLRNLPVVLPDIDLASAALDPHAIEAGIGNALAAHIVKGTRSGSCAIAIRWEGSPLYQRLSLVAAAIAAALDAHLAPQSACVAIVDGDVAGLLGALLDRRFGGRRPIICLDGIHVHEFDHVDIGDFGQGARTLPVVVKSLLFSRAGERAHVH